MNQKFDVARNVYIDLDSHGTVRQLLHTHSPVEIKATTPQIAAANYLKQFGDTLRLSADQLETLGVIRHHLISKIRPLSIVFIKKNISLTVYPLHFTKPT